MLIPPYSLEFVRSLNMNLGLRWQAPIQCQLLSLFNIYFLRLKNMETVSISFQNSNIGMFIVTLLVFTSDF